MEKHDLEGIINGLNEIQPLSHRVEHISLVADEFSLFVDARKMIKLVANGQGEEKLKQLEKLQNQQTILLEEMLTTATNSTSSVDIIEVVDVEELRLALKRVDTEELGLALKRAKSLQMEEFEVFKKADLLLKRLEYICVCEYID